MTRAPTLAACCLAACGAASAQSIGVATAPATEPTPSAAAPRALWELGLGVAALRLPDYRGADQSRTYALPLPYVVYRGTWLKADREGARALLLATERVKVDVSVAASTPTRSSDNTARDGMPNLPGTAEIGPNLNLTLAGTRNGPYRIDLRLPLRAAVSIQRSPQLVGTTFSPHLNLDLVNLVGGWNLGLQAGPQFADRRYHAHFYSVDAAYASAARPAYAAHGGFGGWNALAATSRRFGPMWVGAFVRYDNLRGAAFEPSPLVRSHSAVMLGIGVAWVLAQSAELVPGTD